MLSVSPPRGFMIDKMPNMFKVELVHVASVLLLDNTLTTSPIVEEAVFFCTVRQGRLASLMNVTCCLYISMLWYIISTSNAHPHPHLRGVTELLAVYPWHK